MKEIDTFLEEIKAINSTQYLKKKLKIFINEEQFSLKQKKEILDYIRKKLIDNRKEVYNKYLMCNDKTNIDKEKLNNLMIERKDLNEKIAILNKYNKKLKFKIKKNKTKLKKTKIKEQNRLKNLNQNVKVTYPNEYDQEVIDFKNKIYDLYFLLNSSKNEEQIKELINKIVKDYIYFDIELKYINDDLYLFDEALDYQINYYNDNNLTKDLIQYLKEQISFIRTFEKNKISFSKISTEDNKILQFLNRYNNKNNYKEIIYEVYLNTNNIELKKFLEKYFNLKDNLELEKIAKMNNSLGKEQLNNYIKELAILEKFDEQKEINDESLKVIEIYKFFIRNYNLIEYSDIIENYTRKVIEIIKNIDNDEIIVSHLCSILDNIKYKKLYLKDKGELHKKLENQILKQIKKELKNMLQVYQIKEVKKHDYKYDILYYLISIPGGYNYIEKCLKDIPEMVNVTNNEEHILVKIVEKFLHNLIVELQNQTRDYIDPAYYKQLYFLFKNNRYLELSDIDAKKIDVMLNEMSDFLENNRYDSERKSKALMDLNDIKTNNFGKKEQKMDIKLDDELLQLETNKKYTLLTDKRVNLTKKYLNEINEKVTKVTEKLEANNEKISNKLLAKKLNVEGYDITNSKCFGDTISFNGKNYAYSITREDEYNYFFRIHTFDIASLINLESDIALAMRYNNINLNNLSKIRIGEEIPTITYQFKIRPNGYVCNFNMFNSKIAVDKIYDDTDLESYRNNSYLKEMIGIYRMLNPYDRGKINTEKIDVFFKEFLSKNMINYLEMNNLPYLVYGKDDFNEDEYSHLNSGICYLLSKVNKETFNKVSNIISNNINKNHYTTKYFNGDNSINLLDNVNYEYLILQTMIKDIIKEIRVDTIRDRYSELFEELKKEFNDKIGYISNNNGLIIKNKKQKVLK